MTYGLRVPLGALLAACLGISCFGEKATGTSTAQAPGATRSQTADLVLGTPSLVKDLRPGTERDTLYAPPTLFAELGDTVLFSANDKVHGLELWRSDGTAGGTSLVLDIIPGSLGSAPSHAVVLGGRLYFFAAVSSQSPWLPPFRYGLWRSDGTSQGTVLVRDLGAAPAFLEQRDGVLYLGTLVPGGANSGFALWRSDGTAEGTVLLHSGASPRSFTANMDAAWLGEALLFSAPGPTQGFALWKTDGTPEGTAVLKDPVPGVDSLSVGGLTACNGRVLFWAETSSKQYALWRTDGTEDGTLQVRAIDVADPSSSQPRAPSPLVCSGGAVYFSAWDSAAGQELWRSDGTEAGTLRLADLFPGADSASPTGLTLQGGSLYFVARDGTAGAELWKSDGTPEGTTRVSDVAPGSASGLGGEARRLLSTPGGLFFLADDGVTGLELWKTDGTSQGTVRLTDASEPLFSAAELVGTWARGGLYFWTRDDSLWTSTGSAAGTRRVAPLAGHVAGSFGPYAQEAADLEGTLFFGARDNAHRLWKSNGTDEGTLPVGGTSPLPSPGGVTRLGGRLLVHAMDVWGDDALWSVDTSSQSPQRLASLDGQGEGIVPVGSQAFFTVWGISTYVDSLWRTDGTPEGTVRLTSFSRGRGGGGPPRLLTPLGNRLFFVASEGGYAEALWTSDGTPEGTVRVLELDHPASSFTLVEQLVAMNGRLYFWAYTPARGRELWTSDGTGAGTVSLATLGPAGWTRAGSGNTAVVGSTLFFTLKPDFSPPELWKSDGGAPVRVRTFGTHERVASPGGFTPFGNTLLFWADDGVSGYEPWRSDGTEAGTVRVKDIHPGGAGSVGVPRPFTPLGERGTFLFAASDGASGLELWRTDGTDEGTRRVADLVPGPASSSPQWMVASGQRLYFPAWSPSAGVELWSVSWFEDTEPPQLTCPPAQEVEAVSRQGAPVSYPPATVSDTDPAPVVEYSRASGSTFGLGTTEVRVTATDNENNRAECRFAITVRDTRAPDLECPPAQDVVAESEAGVAVEWPEAQASDAVSTPEVGYAPARGSVFAVGTTEVRTTATDASGNSRSCTFQVRVQRMPAGEPDAGTPDGGSTAPDAGSPDAGGTAPDAGTQRPQDPPGGHGCQQAGGSGAGFLGVALMALLCLRRRRLVGTPPSRE